MSAPKPLHVLISQLGLLTKALAAYHGVDRPECLRPADRAWQAAIRPFKKRYHDRPEVTRALRDPALTWCAKAGIRKPKDATVIDEAVDIIMVLVEHVPVPGYQTNRGDAGTLWDQQSVLLVEAAACLGRLEQLSARADAPRPRDSQKGSPSAAE